MTGKRIDQYLKDHNISKEDLASKVNVPCNVITDICVNDAEVDAVLYYHICEVLGVSLETFLKEAPVPQPI